MGEQLPWQLRERINALCWARANGTEALPVLVLCVATSGAAAVPGVLAKVARLCNALYGSATQRLLHVVTEAFTATFGSAPPPERILRLRRLPLAAARAADGDRDGRGGGPGDQGRN